MVVVVLTGVSHGVRGHHSEVGQDLGLRVIQGVGSARPRNVVSSKEGFNCTPGTERHKCVAASGQDHNPVSPRTRCAVDFVTGYNLHEGAATRRRLQTRARTRACVHCRWAWAGRSSKFGGLALLLARVWRFSSSSTPVQRCSTGIVLPRTTSRCLPSASHHSQNKTKTTFRNATVRASGVAHRTAVACERHDVNGATRSLRVPRYCRGP